MRGLVQCLLQWLAVDREDLRAHTLLRVLATETLKRADSADAEQREFDAEQLAEACGKSDGFEAAKRWVGRAGLETYLAARRAALEQHFRSAGHDRALRVSKRSPGGKHRAVWFLEVYQLLPESEAVASSVAADKSRSEEALVVQYDYAGPGQIQPAWYARPLIGSGSFVTWSWRGVLWLLVLMIPMAYLAVSAFFLFMYQYARRPLETADFASMVLLMALGWLVWRLVLRPLYWLVEDRVANAPQLWTKLSEEPAQFELAATEDNRRKLQLVRYTAVCAVCAGCVELRYSQGANKRRLLGCCSESPQEHVFSFDRVLRQGKRLSSASD